MATPCGIPSSQNRHDLSTTYRLTQYFFIFLYVILAEVSARQVPCIFINLTYFWHPTSFTISMYVSWPKLNASYRCANLATVRRAVDDQRAIAVTHQRRVSLRRNRSVIFIERSDDCSNARVHLLLEIDGPNGAAFVTTEQSSVRGPGKGNCSALRADFHGKESNGIRASQHAVHRKRAGGWHKSCYQVGRIGRASTENR